MEEGIKRKSFWLEGEWRDEVVLRVDARLWSGNTLSILAEECWKRIGGNGRRFRRRREQECNGFIACEARFQALFRSYLPPVASESKETPQPSGEPARANHHKKCFSRKRDQRLHASRSPFRPVPAPTRSPASLKLLPRHSQTYTLTLEQPPRPP